MHPLQLTVQTGSPVNLACIHDIWAKAGIARNVVKKTDTINAQNLSLTCLTGSRTWVKFLKFRMYALSVTKNRKNTNDRPHLIKRMNRNTLTPLLPAILLLALMSSLIDLMREWRKKIAWFYLRTVVLTCPTPRIIIWVALLPSRQRDIKLRF